MLQKKAARSNNNNAIGRERQEKLPISHADPYIKVTKTEAG